MRSVKVNGRYQVTLPYSVRRQLGIKPGDRLLVGVRGNRVLLVPEPSDFARALAGLHADIWEGVEPGEYVRGERGAGD